MKTKYIHRYSWISSEYFLCGYLVGNSLEFCEIQHMKMYCDNQTDIYISITILFSWENHTQKNWLSFCSREVGVQGNLHKILRSSDLQIFWLNSWGPLNLIYPPAWVRLLKEVNLLVHLSKSCFSMISISHLGVAFLCISDVRTHTHIHGLRDKSIS